jgi:hypothetical protein
MPSDRLRHVEALNRYSVKSVKSVKREAICLKGRTCNEHAIITSLDLIKAGCSRPSFDEQQTSRRYQGRAEKFRVAARGLGNGAGLGALEFRK